MFVPAGHDRTFGEMDPAEKHAHQPPRRCVPQAGGGLAVIAVMPAKAGIPGGEERPRLSPVGAPACAGATLALYVHWPFCVSKCPYCDFNSHVRESIDQDGVARGACSPTSPGRPRPVPGRRLTSIFFGGGTPVADGAGDGRGADRGGASAIGAWRRTSRSRSRPIPPRSRRRASPTSPPPGSTGSRSACSRSTTARFASSAAPMTRPRGWPRWRRRRAASTGSAST